MRPVARVLIAALGLAVLLAAPTGCRFLPWVDRTIPAPDVPALAEAGRTDHDWVGVEWISVSPDGRWLGASSTGDELKIIELATGREAVNHRLDREHNVFDGFFMRGSNFAWAEDSSGVFLARGPQARRGFGPSFMAVDGSIRDLPAAALPDAPLTALLYAGGQGKAAAMLGQGGGFAGLDPDLPPPTLAFVDVRDGRVLQSAPYAEVFPTGWHADQKISAATVLSDGRAMMVARYTVGRGVEMHDRWLVWREGEAPRLLPAAGGDPSGALALSPDGRSFLTTDRLVPRSHCPADGGPCRKPSTPTTGELARLISAADGRTLWSMRATAHAGYGLVEPAFSPDGRHVAIGWPSHGRSGLIVLASTADGRIVKRVRLPWPPNAIGFSADGRRFWADDDEALRWFHFDPGSATRP